MATMEVWGLFRIFNMANLSHTWRLEGSAGVKIDLNLCKKGVALDLELTRTLYYKL